MDWNSVEGTWREAKAKIRAKWSKLTDDDLKLIDGQRERLEVKIQQRYGFDPDHVRREVDSWIRWQASRSQAERTSLAMASFVSPNRTQPRIRL